MQKKSLAAEVAAARENEVKTLIHRLLKKAYHFNPVKFRQSMAEKQMILSIA